VPIFPTSDQQARPGAMSAGAGSVAHVAHVAPFGVELHDAAKQWPVFMVPEALIVTDWPAVTLLPVSVHADLILTDKGPGTAGTDEPDEYPPPPQAETKLAKSNATMDKPADRKADRIMTPLICCGSTTGKRNLASRR
jgi:hypothetical protein